MVPAPNILFLWSMKLYSDRTTGKMGKPESMATWKAPFLNGNIWNKNNKNFFEAFCKKMGLFFRLRRDDKVQLLLEWMVTINGIQT